MRIALLAPLFESVPPRFYGGTERVVSNLCRGLTDAHVEVTVFASGDSTVEGRMVAVVEEALRLRREAVKDPVPYHLKMLSMVAERASEFDLIHNHHDYWMLPLSQMTRVPVVSTQHGRLDTPDLPNVLKAFPEAHHVSISNSQRTPLPDLNWAATVYNGIDLTSYALHERPGNYLAFLGRISPEKKPEWAIEIAKKAGVPLKIAAKIEGKEGRDYYDAFVGPQVDGKFIEFVGEISEAEKSDFLGNALALAFPIDWPEPFGLVVIESLACGTPVLARPCGAVREILKDGVTGYCHFQIDELARRVRDIPRIDRFRCRKWVEQKFSLQRMTEDYIHVYRAVAGAARNGSHRHRRDFLHSVERPPDRDS